MGRVEVRKTKTSVALKEDKIVVNHPVDWKETLKLWYNDKEAFNNKTLVRFEIKEHFSIAYIKKSARYANYGFYEFTPTRDVKIKLKEIINNQGIDALPLYYKRWTI